MGACQLKMKQKITENAANLKISLFRPGPAPSEMQFFCPGMPFLPFWTKIRLLCAPLRCIIIRSQGKEACAAMLKKIKEIWNLELWQPLVNKAFTRLVLALAASLLWNEFVNGGLLSMRAYAFLFFGVLFAVAAWMSYLRLDGIHAPQFDKLLFDWKRKPKRTYGDMIDYVDEKPVDFEELEEDEKCLCLLLADAACSVIFLVLSLI